MRRSVVVLIVIVAAFALVGCGGGGDEAAVSEETAPVETAVEPVAAVAEEDPGDTLSPLEDQAFVLFPNDPETTPISISDRIEAGVAMVVFFNDSKQTASTAEQLMIIEDVLADYTGLVDLVDYDIGKYVTSEASGTFTINPGMEHAPPAKQAIGLVKELDVTFTPYIVVVDEYGYITWRNRGLIDEVSLRAQIMRATAAH
ncbi:MAG: hypothetical protein PF636_11585 [Actinomycetota bacterium]|jgi:hypothetical protein|nr:hypothetical protein [Actinomycetota bacterium]